jgi:GNAT superfamily N-acetyltransferase
MESTGITTSSEYLQKNCSIATATDLDLKKLGLMGHQFAKLYGAGIMNFKTDIFIKKMKEFMETGIGTVLCATEDWELKGAVAGVVYENVFDGEKQATELFWYVWPGATPGTGTLLLGAFEEWARWKDCTRVTMAYMIHNMPDRLAHFYEKRGYRPFETHYVKAI